MKDKKVQINFMGETHGLTFPKPGKKVKKQTRTSRPLTKNVIEPPKDKWCVNCKQITGTECYHHGESKRLKMLFGGGTMGGKPPNRASAWLCSGETCGIYFDNTPDQDGPKELIEEHHNFTTDNILLTWNGDEYDS